MVKSYQELCNQLDRINPIQYAKTRNFLGGDVTRLSPYITRGVLTLPQLRDVVLQTYSVHESYTFIQELAWREYFQRVWESRGDMIFEDLRFKQFPVSNHSMPISIEKSQTGIKVIDSEIENLYHTGYLHNHSRLSIASLCCNLGQSHWRVPSRWMYYHLCDGDPASNTLSWQWVAGTSISKKYVTDQSLINYWSESQQENTFLSFDRKVSLERGVPQELEKICVPDLSVYLPRCDEVDFSDGRDLCIYHTFSLDPLWRKDDDVHRILLIEPRWFRQMPISENVMNHIIRLAVTMIPGIQIVVRDFDAFVRQLSQGQRMYVKEHQSVIDWQNARLIKDSTAWLFPDVEGYYKSFFAYWKQCEKFLKNM